MWKTQNTALAAVMVTCAFSSASQASGIDEIFSFGDSLTDCCIAGPFTNGPTTWVTDLANNLGATHAGTTDDNYAIGGAQSGNTNALPSNDVLLGIETGFRQQVNRFEASGTSVGSDDLATIWVGTNDIWPSSIDSGTLFGNPINQPVGLDPTPAALTAEIAGNIQAGIVQLSALGFEKFLILTPYDLALSSISGLGDATQNTMYSHALQNALKSLYTPGVDTYVLDILELFDEFQSDPASFGFDPTRTTGYNNCSEAASAIDPAFECTDLDQATQDSFVFFDGIHVTTAANSIIADRAADLLRNGVPVAPIPVPVPFALLAGGLGLMATLRLGKRQG